MDSHSSIRIIEQIAGGLLFLLVLIDIFLTVLYARMGYGLLSRFFARSTWIAFRTVGRSIDRGRSLFLSFCGPVILILLVLLWGFLLTLGTALVIHPHLGTSVVSNSDNSQRDFVTAMYVGGSSVSIIGGSNYSPTNAPFKLFFLFNSLAGMSFISLTLTYLMQVYSASQHRNSLALKLHLGTDRTNDAATMIAALGPSGHFDSGYTNLSDIAANMTDIKESHHFYPVLFYFRFEEPYYSVSAFGTTALDCVTLIKAALDDTKFGWVKNSSAVNELMDSTKILLDRLEQNFLHGGAPSPETPDKFTRQLWRQRYLSAIPKLHAAGISTSGESGAEKYIELRSSWDIYISRLAPTMLMEECQFDPIMADLRNKQQSRVDTPIRSMPAA